MTDTPEQFQRIPRDPGLQPERTALAWRRTLLSLIVADIFIWRAWVLSMTGEDQQPSYPGLGIAAAAAAAATFLMGLCIHARTKAIKAGEDHAVPASLLKTAAASAILLALAICAAALTNASGSG
jgi:uncharacterized membrane protein YidH (DUF202 family)